MRSPQCILSDHCMPPISSFNMFLECRNLLEICMWSTGKRISKNVITVIQIAMGHCLDQIVSYLTPYYT
ncbi:Protein fem-1 [Trichinella pseudospiralis]